MGKFSDPNYDLLQRYFNIIGSRQTGTQLSYIAGPKRGIWVNGGAFTVLFENHPTYGFVGHKFVIQEIDGNRFKMEYRGVHQDYKKYRTDEETAALTPFEIGNEMYFRKDSFFHEWLRRSDNEAYRNYVNTDRTFAFFGKIWGGGDRSNPDVYSIEFEGLKDYTLRAIPPHNQTTNVKEWLNVYFDQVHHEPYTMLKTLWSLMDAREIDMNWLGYIAQIYGIEINEEMNEVNLREWVENLIYFLKRIGTFNALYVVWKLYLTNTTNVMNVYERWDEWCQPNIWEKDTTTLANVASYDRFPGFHPGLPAGVYSYFGPDIYPVNDYNWLEFYGQQPSGGAGDLWYSQFNPNRYPTHAQEAPSGNCCDSSDDDDFTLPDGSEPSSNWTKYVGQPEQGMSGNDYLTIQNNKLNYSSPGDDANHLTEIVRRNCILVGDFDISVDFDITTLTTPDSFWSYVPLLSLIPYYQTSPIPSTLRVAGISRARESTGNNAYIADNNGWTDFPIETQQLTTDTSGKLRLTRESGVIRAYYWNSSSSQWEWNGNPAGQWLRDDTYVDLRAILTFEQENNSTVNGNVDNFQINYSNCSALTQQRICNDLIWSCGPSESFLCYNARGVSKFATNINTFSVEVSAFNTVDTYTRTLSLSGQYFSGDFEHCAGVTMSNITNDNCSFIFYGLSNSFLGFGSDIGNWIGVAFEKISPTARRFAIYERYGGTVYSTVGIKTDYVASNRYRIGVDRDCTVGTITVYIYDGKRREDKLVETIVHTLNGCPDYTYLHSMTSFTNGLDGEFYGTVWRQHVDLSTFTWSVGPTGFPVITPHYIIEIDLNSEPLVDVSPFDVLFEGQDFIINEFLADELIRNWQYVRPVNKHVLYHELLSPPAKEERVATSVPLYPLDSNGYFNTFFTGSRFLSAGAPTPSAGVSTYLHIQKIAKRTWEVSHGLGSRYNIVQVWQQLKAAACKKNPQNIARRIEPNNIFIIDEDTLRITFDEPISGWVTIAGRAWALTYECFIEYPPELCAPDIWFVDHNFDNTPSAGGPKGYPSGVGPLVNLWLHEVSSSSSSSSSVSNSSSSSSVSSSSLSSSSSVSSSSNSLSSSSSSSSSSVSNSSSSSSSSESSSSSSSLSSSFSLSSVASTLDCHCQERWDAFAPPPPMSAGYPNGDNYVSRVTPTRIVRPTEAATVKDDVIVFWTESPSASFQNPPPGSASTFGGYGWLYGIRMDHCESIIDPVEIWDGNFSNIAQPSIMLDRANHTDASYIPNRGLAVYAITAPVSGAIGTPPFYPDGWSFAEQPYTWVFIVDETTLARTGLSTTLPILVDGSANPVGWPSPLTDEVLVEGYDNFFNVFYNAFDTSFPDPTSSYDGWVITYTYNGAGGTRREWYNSAAIALDKGILPSRPKNIISTLLHEDPSKYIGLFYTNEDTTGASPSPTSVRATITTQSGTVVNNLSEDLSDTVGLGANSPTVPLAVCPYKYDDAGSQMGFMLVYRQGGDVFVRYMSRLATFPGDRRQIVNGVASSHQAWDIIETYRPDQYLIVSSKHSSSLFGSSEYVYWIVDRGTPTLSGGGAPNIIAGSIFGGITICEIVQRVHALGGLNIVKNDDNWSYYLQTSEKDETSRFVPLPVITPDPTLRRCVTYELGSSSSSSSSSSESFSSSSESFSSSSESFSSSSESSSSSSSSSSVSSSSSSSSVSFSSSSTSSSSISFPCPPISDDFTGNNGDLLYQQSWQTPPSGSIYFPITIFDNKASVGPPNRPSPWPYAHEADSRSKIDGDFDMQCRFTLSGAAWDNNGDGIYLYAFSVPGNSFHARIARNKFSGYNSFVTGGSSTSTATTDTSGGLRITRVGDTFTTYRLVGGSWTQHYTYTNASFPSKVEVRLRLGNQGVSNTRASIDNMVVTSPSYPDAGFICAESISSSSTSVAAAQDFSDPSYIEVDSGGYITIPGFAPEEIRYASIPVNLSSDGYVYKDFGVGVIGDFSIDFDWIITAWGGFDTFAWGVMFSNSIGTWYDNQLLSDGIAFGVRRSSGTFDGVLHNFSTTTSTINSNIALSQTCYATIIRSGALMTYEMYSDSGRTALIISGSLACSTTAYRYFFPFTVRGVGSDPGPMTGQTEDYFITGF